MIRAIINFLELLAEKPTYTHPIGTSDEDVAMTTNQKRLGSALNQIANRNPVRESELLYLKNFIEVELEQYVDGNLTYPEEYYIALSKDHYTIQYELNKIEIKKREEQEEIERGRKKIREIVESRRKLKNPTTI